MKHYIALTVSGLIGGLVCFGLMHTVSPQQVIIKEQVNTPTLASNTNFNTGPDFVTAAAMATPAVVHIYAEESNATVSERAARNRRADPFGFDDFFGGDFFGRNYYRRNSGSGSGVIISKDGFIATNNHVVGFADDITVTTQDGKKFKAVKIGTDPATDLAVIKIEANNLSAIQYGDSDKLRVGEWVLAVGNPFDYLTSTVTAGIVSAKGRSLDIIQDDKAIESFIQTDAAVNPGNSGGALVDAQGKLVGINTAIATPTGAYAGYSFAIPTSILKPIVEKIIKYGNLERIELGIGGYDIDSDLVKEFDLPVSHGFYVDQIQMRSAAKMAGILPGDIITQVNNKKVNTYDDIESVLTLTGVGDKINFIVNRKGKEMTISTVLRKQIK